MSRDRWIVSYADFITLLFAFFATLYAISSVDARKFTRVSRSLQAAFDDSAGSRVSAQGAGVLPETGGRLVPGDASPESVAQQVAIDLGSELATHQVSLIADQRGVIISIPEAGTFSTGHDELSPAAEALMARVAVTIGRFANPVRVEGHTDDRPIRTVRFLSNWDLSAARAGRVVEFLIGRGIAPDRLSATGYAEFRPRVPNDSDDARASNRRVDLLVLNGDSRAIEPPATPRDR